MKKIGLYLKGELMTAYEPESIKEAFDDAIAAYEETGLFHEVKEINNTDGMNSFKFEYMGKETFKGVVCEANRRGESDLFDITNNINDIGYIYCKNDIDKFIENGIWQPLV
ncbi:MULTISPECIES: hypothetical protein [Bacillus subtilis group]|uniref:Phage protein n=1 Tax=Bacillus subtilis subsp. subtilis TaxID=135461 RepID=A0ABD3ZS09_BACIU|nr:MULTISPECIES: hypothetical protein [Bacillus subtilis group]KIL30490.1 hypothetical protein B4067_2237 [Bacillus subtilis subsp. subtilis]KIN54100.1 hypothetical protein B4145_2158 [Bacillus subtilis]MDV5127044.1 hypothetical protein [Bacillus velezensis]QIR18905.1 hypothetical protein F0366_12035 [Bacillus subtilis]CAF1780998.1 hypothetical protein NRS6111_03745 [Bacillus subtilis]